MSGRGCALALGFAFFTLGLLGFVPGLLDIPDPTPGMAVPADAASQYAAGFGYLFGLFPTNVMHNLVHLSVGLLGIAASSNARGARLFNRFFAISYVAIAVMGFFPLSQTLFGYMPVFGNNIWFNALTGVLAGYFGFVNPGEEVTRLGV